MGLKFVWRKKKKNEPPVKNHIVRRGSEITFTCIRQWSWQRFLVWFISPLQRWRGTSSSADRFGHGLHVTDGQLSSRRNWTLAVWNFRLFHASGDKVALAPTETATESVGSGAGPVNSLFLTSLSEKWKPDVDFSAAAAVLKGKKKRKKSHL